MTSGVLMLAAGCARRFGSDKRLALLADGQPLLLASVRNAITSGLPVYICLSPGDRSLVEPLQEIGATVIFCSDAARGMGHTLAQGMAQIPDWEAVLIALADMPFIEPATFCMVAENTAPDAICQLSWNHQLGHPVGFGKQHFPALKRLEGDTGARAVIQKNGAALLRLDVDDPGIVKDIDRPADIP